MSESRWAPIIVAYRPGPELVDCVSHLLSAGAPLVTVWDNSPADEAASLLPHDERIKVLTTGQNLGFGAANNRAAAAHPDLPEYVFFVNPDCMINAEAPATLIAALDGDPSLAAVAPRMRYPNGELGIAGGPYPTLAKEVLASLGVDALLPPALRRRALAVWGWRSRMRGRAGFEASFGTSDTITVDWVSGFAMMCRTSAFREVGGFDESYFLYFEDVDISAKFASRDYKVAIVQEASALHLESVSTGGARKSKHYRTGLRRYFSKRGSALERAVSRLFR